MSDHGAKIGRLHTPCSDMMRVSRVITFMLYGLSSLVPMSFAALQEQSPDGILRWP